jgi:hypothetical protein
MAREASAPDGINETLHKAIGGLRKDVTRVEIWATALSSFAKPIPGYRPNPKYELGQPIEPADLAEKGDREPARSKPRNRSL